MKIQFKVSYRGEAEYWYGGHEYCVRFFANDDGYYNGNYYQTGIEPFVGTLRNRRDFHEFPPQDVLEVFKAEFPGIVGARYNSDFTEVEYTDTPDRIEHRGNLCAGFHVAEMKKYGF